MLLFNEFLNETVISPGFKPEHEPLREKHRQEIHDILHNSYKSIGGYSGHPSGSKEESDAIHHDITHTAIKATRHNGKVTSAVLYKKQHGRKIVGIGTDGSEHGKKGVVQTLTSDHRQKRAWGEVSGKVEHLANKIGFPKLKAHHTTALIGKHTIHSDDGEHYTRSIGGHNHEKVGIGHPKENS